MPKTAPRTPLSSSNRATIVERRAPPVTVPPPATGLYLSSSTESRGLCIWIRSVVKFQSKPRGRRLATMPESIRCPSRLRIGTAQKLEPVLLPGLRILLKSSVRMVPAKFSLPQTGPPLRRAISCLEPTAEPLCKSPTSRQPTESPRRLPALIQLLRHLLPPRHHAAGFAALVLSANLALPPPR